MAEKNHKCPNCGAKIDKLDASCPYCGYINVEGAEKKYMDELEEVRSKLDVVDDEAREDYAKGLGSIVRVILVAVVIMICVISLILIIYSNIRSKKADADLHSGEDILQEMTWKKENYPKFDKMYEDHDYEGLYATVEDARIEKNHSVYDWQHYDFYEGYCYYIYAKEHCETIDKQGWTENRGGLLVYECLVCIFEIGDGKRGLDDDELKRLEPYYSEIEDIVTNKLMISKESYEEVRNAVCDEYGNVSLDACDAYAKEHLSEFR